MSTEPLSTRPNQTSETAKGKDFYNPENAPQKADVIGAIPESKQQQAAQEHLTDRLQAEVTIFVELNQAELGIPQLGQKKAIQKILEMYTILKETGEIQKIEEYDWKAFLAGSTETNIREQRADQADQREASVAFWEKEETTRETETVQLEKTERASVEQNIDQEQSIDHYLEFIREQKELGLDSRTIIDQLLDSDAEKGFDVPAEYIPQLRAFRELLSADLGLDSSQIENFVATALVEQQSFHSVAERIFASKTVSEATKLTIAEKFNLPYIATKTDFRKVALTLQQNLDDLQASSEAIRQNLEALDEQLDTIKTQIADLAGRQNTGQPLTSEETAQLEQFRTQRKILKKRIQENQENARLNEENLAHLQTDPDGHPIFQYCGFDVAVDQAKNQAVFQTEYGECPVPLAWYNYAFLSGEKISNRINSFLISTQFAEAGLAEHCYTAENQTPFIAEFIQAAGIGKTGELVAPNDLNQARNMLKLFSPDPTNPDRQSAVIHQNLQNVGIMDPTGNLDTAQWKKAMAFIDMNKHTSRYTYQDLKAYLQNA